MELYHKLRVIAEFRTSDVEASGSTTRRLSPVTFPLVQGGSNMTGTNCDLFTHK
jgi:hypothetical protein